MHRWLILATLGTGCWTSSTTTSSGPLVRSVAVRDGELLYETCGFDYVADTDHDLTRSIFPTGFDERLREQDCRIAHVALGGVP